MSNDSPSYLEIDRGVPPSQTDGGAAESGSVAREMAASYRRLVESYRQEWGLSAADSDARTREPHEPAWREAISKGAPESLLWWELSSVAEQNPDLMHTLWERAKREAVQELASGHRAAGVLEFIGTPWDRARFLAIRAAFRDKLRPKGGIEDALIDVRTQAYTTYLEWLRLLQMRSAAEAALEMGGIRREGRWPIGSIGSSYGRSGPYAICAGTLGW